jgi:hypothetical protein
MVGPPNQGADLASKFGDNPLVAFAIGTPGQQLGKLWPKLEPRLATPECEFGIIAGGSGKANGLMPIPLVSGDNDGLVTVASTRLAGARDFIVLPVPHVNMFRSPEIQRYTLRFLKLGFFISEEDRHPIRDDD